MRAQIDATALAAAMKDGVAGKGVMQILGYALIESEPENDALSITTYSVLMRARTRIAATVVEGGQICADANSLRAAAMGFGSIEIADNQVRRGRGRLKLPTLPPADFPMPDAIRWDDAGIAADALRSALAAVAFATRRGDPRSYCRCVVLTKGLCAGADGHRASLVDVEYQGPTLLIPIEAVPNLQRALAAAKSVQIGYIGDSASFIAANGDGYRLEVALEPAVTIPYLRQMLPVVEPKATAIVLRAMLISELERMGPFCVTGKQQMVVFEVDDQLWLRSANGENESDVAAEVTGSARLGFNSDYVVGALGVLNGESVKVELYEDKFVARDEARGVVQVIASVRV